MTNIDWVGFIPASVAVILAPGPGSLFVARSAAAGGLRAARSAMLGILTGDILLISLSFLGVSALFAAYPSLFRTLRLAGASYLIFLGLRLTLTSPKKDEQAGAGESNGTFKKGMTITLSNPKAIFFFMAFFPLFLPPGGEGFLSSYAIMTTLFLGANQAYLFFLSQVSSRVGSAFQENSRLQSVARKSCGLLFIIFGIKIALFSR
jgi:leucine efflux protein